MQRYPAMTATAYSTAARLFRIGAIPLTVRGGRR